MAVFVFVFALHLGGFRLALTVTQSLQSNVTQFVNMTCHHPMC